MKCETDFKTGLQRIMTTQRPGMVIIHKSWCEVCKTLKPQFLSSKDINHLSNSFVVISLLDDADPRDPRFDIDGAYTPRIFFLTPSGQVMPEVMNTRGDPKFKYYYANVEGLVQSMQIVLNCYPPPSVKSNLVWETNLDAGLDKIKSSQRPGMIVCHKSWCEACRKLKPKFSTSREIETLSCGFVLISLMDDDLPKAKKFQPDGDYVPRILFVNPQGTVMVEIINEEGSSDYKYFYGEPSSIARSMKKVLAMYPLQGLAG